MKFLLQEAKGLECPGRLTLEVRATRAYIASFGTAGSLVAGAAVVFVLASAVVGFRGWPSVAGSSQPVTVEPASSTGRASHGAAKGLSVSVAAAASSAGV